MQHTGNACSDPSEKDVEGRKRWMGVLARSSAEDLEKAWEKLDPLPAFSHLRKPEVGLVMVRARAGGNGPLFNLGEMTVTRCTVQVEGGAIGCGYVVGRTPGHAEAAAVFDALLRDKGRHDFILKEIILPLEAILKGKNEREAARAASTRVEFFSMVRGDSF
jgi:alpha-D-ribose 1-methylphosphonate 5-triphosphate synthase subunit PhnG